MATLLALPTTLPERRSVRYDERKLRAASLATPHCDLCRTLSRFCDSVCQGLHCGVQWIPCGD